MKARLKKKRHLGKFDYKGFEINCKFTPPLSEEALDRLMNDFIDFIESVDLGCGGGADPLQMGQFITKYIQNKRGKNRSFHGADCTETDKELVLNWLNSYGIKEIEIGPLKGAWH